jgi:hypothetical protein
MRYRQLPQNASDKAEGAHEQVQEFTQAPRIIPGTAEWVRQKAAEEAKAAAAQQQAQEQSESAVMPKVAYDVETFTQKPLVVPWKIAAGKWTVCSRMDYLDESAPVDEQLVYDLQGDWNGVLMSTRSIISSSCHDLHSSQSVLYGVAYSAITVMGNQQSAENANSQVFAEGVTLFPLGEEWMRRALFCLGKRLHAMDEHLLEELSETSAAEESVVSYREMCTFVRHLIVTGQERGIEEDPFLIQAIDLLFADFLVSAEWMHLVKSQVGRRFQDLVSRYRRRQVSRPPQQRRLAQPRQHHLPVNAKAGSAKTSGKQPPQPAAKGSAKQAANNKESSAPSLKPPTPPAAPVASSQAKGKGKSARVKGNLSGTPKPKPAKKAKSPGGGGGAASDKTGGKKSKANTPKSTTATAGTPGSASTANKKAENVEKVQVSSVANTPVVVPAPTAPVTVPSSASAPVKKPKAVSPRPPKAVKPPKNQKKTPGPTNSKK